MFGLSQAKCVGREELDSESPAPSPDRELQHLFLKHIRVNYTSSAVYDNEGQVMYEDVDQTQVNELDFRLFATSAGTSKAPVARIRIQSPVGDSEINGLLRSRPRSNYFTKEPSSKARLQLRSAALTGEQVLEKAIQRCPGLKLPWRVTVIPPSSNNVNQPLEENIATGGGKKRRKGKKARIATRKKYAKELELARIARIAAEDKKLAERMKKAKKNRDKKLRQREKEKAKKAAARAEKAQAGEEDNG